MTNKLWRLAGVPSQPRLKLNLGAPQTRRATVAGRWRQCLTDKTRPIVEQLVSIHALDETLRGCSARNGERLQTSQYSTHYVVPACPGDNLSLTSVQNCVSNFFFLKMRAINYFCYPGEIFFFPLKELCLNSVR